MFVSGTKAALAAPLPSAFLFPGNHFGDVEESCDVREEELQTLVVHIVVVYAIRAVRSPTPSHFLAQDD